jgi:O-antigen/teichoic acid export membrane protein
LKREFILNLLLLVFINILIKPFFIFGIDLTVQNRLPNSDYGRYFALLSLALIFQIIADCGIQNFNNRHVSQHPVLMPKYFPNLLALKILLSGVYLVITPLAAWLVFGYGWHDMPLLFILLCNQALVQMIFFLRSNMSGLGYYRTDSFLSSLDKLLMLVSCGILLWGSIGVLSVEKFALAQTIALIVTVCIVFFLLRRKVSFPIKPSWAQNWRAGRPALLALLRKSYPFALVVLLMFAYTRLDAVILERMLPDGKVHADVYAGGYRILDALNMFGYLFASLLLPMFARMLKSDPKGGSTRPLLVLSFKLIWVASITMAAAIYFAKDDLLHLMMPEKYSLYRSDVMGVLIWTFVPVSIIYVFSTLLTAHECLSAMNRYFIAGIILDIILNFLLIPRYQALGSAYSALITQSFVAGATIWLCMRTFGYRFSIRSILKTLGFAILVLGGSWWIYSSIDIPFFYKICLTGILGLSGALLFRLLDFRFIKTLTLDKQ